MNIKKWMSLAICFSLAFFFTGRADAACGPVTYQYSNPNGPGLMGGYVARSFCSGRNLAGLGATHAEAAQNLNDFDSQTTGDWQVYASGISHYPGVVVNFHSPGGWVSGAGYTLAGAGKVALELAKIKESTGRFYATSTSQVTSIPGVIGAAIYKIKYSSAAGGNYAEVEGLGGDMNQAGLSSVLLARISSESGCSYLLPNSSVVMLDGGYRLRYNSTAACGSVEGMGTTAVDAAKSAADFLQLFHDTGCAFSPTGFPTMYVGGFSLVLSAPSNTLCGGSPKLVSGVGSTFTDTAVNALGFSEIAALGGPACRLNSPVSHGTGGYRAMFYCGNVSVLGVGLSAKLAGQSALDQARQLFLN